MGRCAFLQELSGRIKKVASNLKAMASNLRARKNQVALGCASQSGIGNEVNGAHLSRQAQARRAVQDEERQLQLRHSLKTLTEQWLSLLEP